MEAAKKFCNLSYETKFKLKTFLLFIIRYLRAVAYRWVVRWIFGYLGWDNTRPFPACIYNHIREKYQVAEAIGYASAQERQ